MSATYTDYLEYKYKSKKSSEIRLILPNFPKADTSNWGEIFSAPTVFPNWRENWNIKNTATKEK